MNQSRDESDASRLETKSAVREVEDDPGSSGAKETARRLGSTLHVCQLTACTLPVDEYAKGGAKYRGGGSSGGRPR